MEDEKIIQLYWDREEEALSQTQAVYGSRLHGLARRFLEEEDAREAVNDTYLAAWNSIPPQRPTHFFAYLAKLCRNRCLNLLERCSAQKRSAQVVELTREMELCIPDKGTLPDSDSRELGEWLNAFLAQLPKERRVIFLRRYWFGDSVAQIASQLGITQSKVKTGLHRTRNQLRTYLERKGVSL
ncbi:MAG: sigma-70 family RNA polymerase sigma factor [Ruminococcaceae bacterium]|nr:sigma-70 family RNA polymerase sigma factor [Oscillospiraceae bacterium]